LTYYHHNLAALAFAAPCAGDGERREQGYLSVSMAQVE
jgi:hypothetical protein